VNLSGIYCGIVLLVCGFCPQLGFSPNLDFPRKWYGFAKQNIIGFGSPLVEVEHSPGMPAARVRILGVTYIFLGLLY
jgi:hypothetical protein